MTKLEKCLLECYKVVYRELGEDFNIISEVDNFFMDYQMDHNRQSEILNTIIKKYKLSYYQRKLVSTSYWLGCSPKDK
jgi:hypothetical protein